MTNREEDAIILIEKAIAICSYCKSLLEEDEAMNETFIHCINLIGKLNLIKISLDIKNKWGFSIENQLNESKNLFH